MDKFLDIVAKHLVEDIQNRSHSLKDYTIIFPNKRASLFFNQSLTKYMPTPFWAPRYTTINDVYQAQSDLTVADPVLLIFYLYQAYKEVTHSPESFDHFYSWGEVLLNDFEDIDNNMVDAEKLFINITDIEELTHFDFIDEEQEKAIQKLFNSFSTSDITQLHQHYLKMWEAMLKIYTCFRDKLRKGNYAYGGMLKRHIAERMKYGEHTDELLVNNIKSMYSHTVIVGFNALNETDKILFKFLKDECDTTFFWDYDETYMGNRSFEAGQFIEDNIKLFGNALAGHHENFQGLKHPKNIKLVASATDTAQCRYAGQWLESTLQANSPLNQTAVVLCDENLLLQLLHSIPSTYGEQEEKTLLNITMGYPMQGTPAASFVMSLMELYFRGWNKPKDGEEGKWRYLYAEKVLKHPYTMMVNKQDVLSLIKTFTATNNTYPSPEEFHGYFIEDIFATPSEDLLTNLHHIANLVQIIAVELADKQKGNTGSQALYAEAIYNAWTMINNFCNLIEHHGLTFETPDTLIRLLRQAIGSKSIAFHGEPAIGVQVMGILETRNLDFENIILLSVNEGTLPKASHTTSFILNFLRESNGMTTTRRQVNLYAYYFYRLLQRAKKITLVYNNATDGLHRGEMSRFLMQLKYEQNLILSPETSITEWVLDPKTSEESIVLSSNEDTEVKAVRNIPITAKNMSPTALNSYIDCGFRFYLQYVCGFREREEMNEDVEANMFGSIFHNAMQQFYQDVIGQELTHAFYSQFVTEKEGKNGLQLIMTPHGHHVIQRLVDKAFAKEMFHVNENKIEKDQFVLHLNGTQRLNHEVITRYVEKQIKHDSQLCPLTIIATEKTHWHAFPFMVNGLKKTVNIGGTIDREDIVTINGIRQHRIVDYKTSNAKQTSDSVDDLFIQSKKRSGYIFQAFYYSEVRMEEALEHNEHLAPLAPSLVYVKKKLTADESAIQIGKIPVTNYQEEHHKAFSNKLHDLLAEIYRPDNEFSQTTNIETCTYCPFDTFCQKTKQKN